MAYKSKLKQGSYSCLKQPSQRGKLSSKLTIWVQNGFWPFKTQRNARKLLVEAKFKSYYLFQARSMQFEPENMEFLDGQWVSSKFPMNFKLIVLILKWAFLFHLWVQNWFGTHPNFELRHWWLSLSPETRQHKFQMPPSNSKHFILI